MKRFWEKVDKSGDCWVWTGRLRPDGYARVGYKGGRCLVHRLSWILHYGEIQDGMDVLHTCDNPPCVNPNHLFLGTHLENMQDRDSKGRGKIPRISGSRHWNSSLHEGDVRVIRDLHANGCMQKHICEFLGIASGVVSEIVNRKAWKHVQ